MPATDDELLSAARGGDEEALGELLRRHAAELRRSLAGRIPGVLRGVLSEEDLLQETYTDAFLAIGRFVPCGAGAFGAWLKRMAHNNLRDALRMVEAEKRGGGRRAVSGRSSEESLHALYQELMHDSRTSPSGHAARNEAAGALTEALRKLPEPARRVIEDYDLQGRPVREVATDLGRSPGAVYLLRNRANRRLRELLGGSSRFFGDSS